MNLQQLLNSISPEIYENLKRAIELGKWLDGSKISLDQRELCMQAIIAYEHKHLPPEEHTGYIPPKPLSVCGDDHKHDHHEEEHPVKWVK